MKSLSFAFVLCFSLVFFLSGCNNQEINRLKAENDSLRFQMEVGEKAVLAFQEISLLIDSIDASRNILRLEMVHGMPYESYEKRMENVLDYVKRSENKIIELQGRLGALQNENSAYNMMIEALRSELMMATSEIKSLQTQVQRAEKKNTELIHLVHVQEAEIEHNQVQIEHSKNELALFENRMHELMLQAKVNEADAYYARAEAVYEAAKRTKLAPRKKKETLKEALELYKKAASLGNKQAQAKVNELPMNIY